MRFLSDKSPSFYSGYNELVYSSSEWNDHLPNTIEAFFVIPSAGDWNAIFTTQKRHRSFLYTTHTAPSSTRHTPFTDNLNPDLNPNAHRYTQSNCQDTDPSLDVWQKLMYT